MIPEDFILVANPLQSGHFAKRLLSQMPWAGPESVVDTASFVGSRVDWNPGWTAAPSFRAGGSEDFAKGSTRLFAQWWPATPKPRLTERPLWGAE